MSTELKLEIREGRWTSRQLAEIREFVLGCPTFKKVVDQQEIWLRSSTSASTWGYDIRIIFRGTEIWVDVLDQNSESYGEDVRALRDRCRKFGDAVLVDEDGELYDP